jgi:simple sugar transport system substrate-binding protein
MLRKASSPLALVLTVLCLVCGACERDSGSTSSTGTGTGPATSPTTTSAVTPTTVNTVDLGGTSTPAANQAAGDSAAPSAGALAKPGGGKVTVGFSQIGAESAWRTAETESIRSEAANRGVDLKFADAQGKQENQIRALRNFITQKVDAIIFAPVVETGWEPVLRDAQRAKIPVILVDRGVQAPEALYTTLIASDFVAEGRMAGEWLAKATNGQCNIAELQGTTGAAPANDRAKGFREAIAGKSGMKIILSQTGDFTRAKGKDVMEAFLKSPQGGQIQAVYAHNDDMALGAIQAIEEAGKKPGQDIKIVSIDAVKGAFEAMVAGKLNCTVECNPLLGPAAFDAVAKALAGQPVPKKTIVQDQVFEQAQAKDVIGSRKY